MLLRVSLLGAMLFACGGGHDTGTDAGVTPDGQRSEPTDGGGTPCTESPTACAALWEQHASDAFDTALADPTALAAFLKAVPKGGDLHNHLSGAVYAETYLDWGRADGDCINSTSKAAVAHSACSTTNVAMPSSGALFDAIIAAWSMEGFVAGTMNGHDHFFATFGKYGLVAGGHRDQTIADVATRAADENEVYVETMFNLGKNTGTLADSISSGPITAADLPALYANLTGAAGFTTAVTNDTAVLTSARTGYTAVLGCNDLAAPAACDVTVRFIAQVSRTCSVSWSARSRWRNTRT